MTQPLKVPQFDYAPMKVSFKKKVNLCDLTPKRNTIRRDFATAVIVGFMIAIGILCAIGALFGGEGIEDA